MELLLSCVCDRPGTEGDGFVHLEDSIGLCPECQEAWEWHSVDPDDPSTYEDPDADPDDPMTTRQATAMVKALLRT